MKLSEQSEKLYIQIRSTTKLGDLRTLAKAIKKDHTLALELWSTQELMPCLLSILIMDNKELHLEIVESFLADIQQYPYDERLQLTDWLMANQLTKNKKILEAIASWCDSPSTLQRRIFWYHQGRLRWVGQTPPDNTPKLLQAIEKNIATEKPEVQWAMNFTAGWIGVFDKAYRERCLQIGEKFGLYKGEMVSKGCTPNYLPLFIEIEAHKRNL